MDARRRPPGTSEQRTSVLSSVGRHAFGTRKRDDYDDVAAIGRVPIDSMTGTFLRQNRALLTSFDVVHSEIFRNPNDRRTLSDRNKRRSCRRWWRQRRWQLGGRCERTHRPSRSNSASRPTEEKSERSVAVVADRLRRQRRR